MNNTIEVVKRKLLNNKIVINTTKLSAEALKIRKLIKSRDFGCQTRTILELVGMMRNETLIDADETFHFVIVECKDDPKTGYKSRLRDGRPFILVKSYDENKSFHIITSDDDYIGQSGQIEDFKEVEDPEEALEKFNLEKVFNHLTRNYSTEECLRILL